jgi:hypothetical protein
MGDTRVRYIVQGKAESVHLHTSDLRQRQNTTEFQRRNHSRRDLKTILFVEFIRDFIRLKIVRKSQQQVVLEFQLMTKAVW